MQMAECFAHNTQIIVNGFMKSSISNAIDAVEDEQDGNPSDNEDTEDDFDISDEDIIIGDDDISDEDN